MPSRLSPPRWPCLLVVALLSLAGCEKDEIHSDTVPRVAPVTVKASVRLLVAVVENGKDMWFFKLVGSIDEIGKHEKDFLGFLETLRFTDKNDKPIEWQKPSGWEEGPGGEFRFATLYLGAKGKAPELTIHRFDMQSSLLANINRWCERNLGRPHIRKSELKEFTKRITVGNKPATLVDMSGPGVAPGDKPPMAGGMRRPKPLPITYTTPDGWVETGPRMEGSQGIKVPILTAFTIGEGEKKAETTVTFMPKMDVELIAQVNRWRGQVGLRSITQQELDQKPPESIRVGGEEAQFFEFKGSEKRMLLVTVKRPDWTWYFKLLGNPEQVDNNKSKFHSFIQSVKFNGAPR